MLPSIFELIEFHATVLTILMQIYIFYLIKYVSPKSMHEYKFFLYQLTFWDLVFTVTLGILWQPTGVLPILAGLVKGYGKYFGLTFCNINTGIVFYSAVCVIGLQDYSLMYRYSVLHSNRIVHRMFMSWPAKIILFCIAQSFSVALGYGFYSFLIPSKEVPKFILNVFYNETTPNIQPNDTVVIVDAGTPPFFLYCKIVMFTFTLSEVMCVLLIVLILKILKESSAIFSKQTYRIGQFKYTTTLSTTLKTHFYKLHLQFTLLLAAQLLTPFIFIFGPVIICIIAMLQGVASTELASQLGILGLVFYGLANSLLTILFVTPYKKHFVENFIMPWLKPVLMKMGKGHWLPRARLTSIMPSTQSTFVVFN